MVIKKMLSQLGEADGGKGQQRGRAGAQLRVDLGSDALGLVPGRGDFRAVGPAQLTVVQPSGPMVQIDGNLPMRKREVEARLRRALCSTPGACVMHQMCTRSFFEAPQREEKQPVASKTGRENGEGGIL